LFSAIIFKLIRDRDKRLGKRISVVIICWLMLSWVYTSGFCICLPHCISIFYNSPWFCSIIKNCNAMWNLHGKTKCVNAPLRWVFKPVAYPEWVLRGLSTPSFSVLFLKLDIILLKQKPVVVNYKTGDNEIIIAMCYQLKL